jgi:hypothetical protein
MNFCGLNVSVRTVQKFVNKNYTNDVAQKFLAEAQRRRENIKIAHGVRL